MKLQSVKKIKGQIFSTPLIDVAGCQRMCRFFFFYCFHNFDLGGGGYLHWYSESFIIGVPLTANYGGKVQISRALIFFQNQLEEVILLQARFHSVSLVNSTIPQWQIVLSNLKIVDILISKKECDWMERFLSFCKCFCIFRCNKKLINILNLTLIWRNKGFHTLYTTYIIIHI